MEVGVLALQGDVREHRAALTAVGVTAREVRRPADLDGLGGIVLPGGESTTLSMLLESSGLFEPLGAAIGGGLPVFGTCAGMILLAESVEDGRPDQRTFGALSCTVRRNGYGRQRWSFESVLDADGLVRALGRVPPTGAADGDPPPAGAALPAVFIRAPVVVSHRPGVEVLATLPGRVDGRRHVVAVRQGNVLAATFHPELTADRRLHRLFAAMASSRPDTAR
ncbi:MAG: pyridoxal 5'-phosphate synthase glutaminase subunit PdxT [Acidimicrobiales bacterium]